jgi:energy-coupling factor transporter transmembrane protein EcfT
MNLLLTVNFINVIFLCLLFFVAFYYQKWYIFLLGFALMVFTSFIYTNLLVGMPRYIDSPLFQISKFDLGKRVKIEGVSYDKEANLVYLMVDSKKGFRLIAFTNNNDMEKIRLAQQKRDLATGGDGRSPKNGFDMEFIPGGRKDYKESEKPIFTPKDMN